MIKHLSAIKLTSIKKAYSLYFLLLKSEPFNTAGIQNLEAPDVPASASPAFKQPT